MNRDVFIVIIKDPSGAEYMDSIHLQANGRGKSYGKVGALKRFEELRREGKQAELRRLPTGIKLNDLYTLERR